MTEKELREALQNRRPVEAFSKFRGEKITLGFVTQVLIGRAENGGEEILVECADLTQNNCRVICKAEDVSYK